ncbi:MAG: BsuPI-related putative proteinase inhibitor [Anaerolineae bacterium]
MMIVLVGCLSQPVKRVQGGNIWNLELWVNSACASPGDTVTARLTLTNVTTTVQTIELKDKAVLDLGLGYGTDQGPKVTKWSDNKPLTPELTQLVLKPSESKMIEMQMQVPPRVTVIGVVGLFNRDPNNPDDQWYLPIDVRVTDCNYLWSA